MPKWFNFHRIPANPTESPNYQSIVFLIQMIGTRYQSPTPKEIHDIYLDEEVTKLKDWIKSYNRQWNEYRVTLKCDSWTQSTRISIINFLVYCNIRVIFTSHFILSIKFKMQTK